MCKLGINIDHVATLRNARGQIHPDPLKAAMILKECKVDSVTMHLREDRRHIKDDDIFLIKDKVDLPISQINIIDKVFSKEFDRAFLDILLRDLGLRFKQVESIRDNMGSEFITNLLNEPETLLKRSVEIDGIDKIVSRVNIQDLKNLLNRFEVPISEEKLILMSIEDFLISEEAQDILIH